MGVDDDSTAGKPKPTIQVPPRASMEFLFTNGSFPGFSPGPMTLVSNLFPEQGQFSFSQLLAGAMVSPLGAKTGSLSATDSDKEQKKEGFSEDVSGGGIKRTRPANLVVPPPLPQLEGLSLLFLFPPGMSPSGLLNSPGILSPLQSPFGMSHQQVLAHVTAQAALSESFKQLQPEYQPPPSTHPVEVTAGHLSPVPIATLAQPTNAFPQEPESSKVESSTVSSSEKSTTPYVGGSSKPAGDGYNWRKYGQKHVKASECPRSYYKCTYYNCPVKKKVELSVDGQVCGITYKGQHNHDPPQSSKRGKDSSSADRTVNSQAKPELRIVQYPSSEIARLQPSTLVASNRKVEETAVAAHLTEDEEPMTKRRSMDSGASIPASSLQTVTESKIVLQTRSEVDLLDDGYRWRKYGQKVVKGNPYPRSYYRCTYAGCNVRKHVERASSDPKSVITTYEGKHNHDLPIGKNSHRVASDASSQQLQAQTQKSASRNPSSPNEDRLENKDGIPVTYNKL